MITDRLAYKPDDLPAILPIGRTRIFALIKSGELESVQVEAALNDRNTVNARASSRLTGHLPGSQSARGPAR